MNSVKSAVGDLLYRWACLPADKRCRVTDIDPGLTSCLDALEHEYALVDPSWFTKWSVMAAARSLKVAGK